MPPLPPCPPAATDNWTCLVGWFCVILFWIGLDWILLYATRLLANIKDSITCAIIHGNNFFMTIFHHINIRKAKNYTNEISAKYVKF